MKTLLMIIAISTTTGCAQICPAITKTSAAEQVQYCAVIKIKY